MADQLVMDNKTSVISMGKDRLLSRHSDAMEPTLASYAEEMSVAQASHTGEVILTVSRVSIYFFLLIKTGR